MENANKTFDSLVMTQNEIKRQLHRLEQNPNMREILEANIRRLISDIRVMEVDKKKFEIIEKSYKRIEYLQSDIDLERKIINLENLLQATLDKIREVEDEKFKHPDGKDPIEAKIEEYGARITETLNK